MTRQRVNTPIPSRTPLAGEGLGEGVLLAIVFLAFVLRVIQLDFQPLWWDEGWTLYFATSDVPTMIERTAVDIHPPLYYLLLHLWINFLGPGTTSVRLFSVAVGVLTVPLIFLVGRRLFGERVGLLATLVLAIAPLHVYYSQEVRMYGLVTLLGLLSVYLMLRLLDANRCHPQRSEEPALSLPKGSPPFTDEILRFAQNDQSVEITTKAERSGLWAAYVVTTAAAMYTQYYAAVIPVFQTLFVLFVARLAINRQANDTKPAKADCSEGDLSPFAPLARRFIVGRPLVAQWLAAQAALVVLYLPWVVYAGTKLAAYVVGKVALEKYTPLDPLTFLVCHLAAFSIGHLAEGWGWLVGAAVIFVALALLGLLQRQAASDRWQSAFLLLYLFVPLVLAYLVSLRFPFTPPRLERLLLLAAPAFYLLLAAGLAWLRARSQPVFAIATTLIVAACAVSLLSFYSVPRYPNDDYRPVATRMQALTRPEDIVLCVHPWQVGYFRAYIGGDLPMLDLVPAEEWAADPTRMRSDLDALAAKHRRLWLPAHQTLGRMLESDIEDYLARSTYPALNEWFSQSTRLSFYAVEGAMSPAASPANFADALMLASTRIDPGPHEAGWGIADIYIAWQRVRLLPGTYRVGLRLTDSAGRTWGQRDSEPVSGLYPFAAWPTNEPVDDHHGLLVPAGTPPGTYQVRVGVYRTSDDQGLALSGAKWLSVLDAKQQPQGVEFVLGTVQVIAPKRTPPVEALGIAQRVDANFGGRLRLLGATVSEGPIKPGATIRANLYWQALAATSADYRATLQLQDRQGKAWASVAGLVGDTHPTSAWGIGELVREQRDLVVPADAPSGTYRLVVQVEELGHAVTVAPIRVKARVHSFIAPQQISHPLKARLGEWVEFLGYDLDTQQIAPGGVLNLRLYWRGRALTSTSYTVFVHLIDGEDRIWGQEDHVPGRGEFPTTSWFVGEYITDDYVVPMKAETPPGTYVLEIGMYDVTTGVRLPAFDANGQPLGDRILLDATPIAVGKR